MTKAVLAPSVPMVPKCISEIIVPIASDMVRCGGAVEAPARRLAGRVLRPNDRSCRSRRGLKPLQGVVREIGSVDVWPAVDTDAGIWREMRDRLRRDAFASIDGLIVPPAPDA